MTKNLYSKISLLTTSYFLEQALNNNEQILTLTKEDDIRSKFYDFVIENEIDLKIVSDEEFDACIELIEDFLIANQDKEIKISITN